MSSTCYGLLRRSIGIGIIVYLTGRAEVSVPGCGAMLQAAQKGGSAIACVSPNIAAISAYKGNDLPYSHRCFWLVCVRNVRRVRPAATADGQRRYAEYALAH